MKALSTSRHAKPSGAKSASRSHAAKTQTAAESAPQSAHQPAHPLVVRSTGSEAAAALLDGMNQATHDAIDAAGRHQMIAESAYFRAERRGFDGGRDVDDWLDAEQEIDGYLRDHGHEELRAHQAD